MRDIFLTGMSWAELVRHGPALAMRTLVLYFLVVAVMRWTGKRSAGHMAPFDLALVIMISEVAAIPISDLDVDLLHGLLPVILLGMLHIILSWAHMRSRRLEVLTEGQPTLLVADGQVLMANLARERVSLADLEAALRLQGVQDARDVSRAWLEPQGGVSVIRQEEVPLTPRQVDALAALVAERVANRVVRKLRRIL